MSKSHVFVILWIPLAAFLIWLGVRARFESIWLWVIASALIASSIAGGIVEIVAELRRYFGG